MGRSRKPNKPAATTISISVDLRDRIHQQKWHGSRQTISDLSHKVLSEWVDLKDAIQYEKIVNELVTKQKEQYEGDLNELKSIAKVRTFEELKSKLHGLSQLV